MRPRRHVQWLLSSVVVVLMAGCSARFKEQYYVGVYDLAEDGQARPTQFYRFRIEGDAPLFSKTRYEAGWYDAGAVERLFGEIRNERVVKAGQPQQQHDTITSIPIVFVDGTASADKDLKASSASVAAENAQTIKCENIKAVLADRVRIDIGARMIEFSGPITVVLDVSLSNLSGAVTPTTAGEAKLTVSAADQVILSGGAIQLLTGEVKLQNTEWSGQFDELVSEDAFHHLDVKSGTFAISGGQVTRTAGGLRVANARVVASAKSDASMKLATKRGWRLELRQATAKLTDARVTLPDGHYVVHLPEGADFNMLDPEDDNHRRVEAQKEFENAGVQFKAPVASGIERSGIGGAVQEQVTFLTAGTLSVSGGAYSLTTAAAVVEAESKGKRVVLSDAANRSFVHFGPEGVARAVRDDERFVVVMSANPRALINRIRALVNSETARAVVGNAIFAPKLIADTHKISHAGDALAMMKDLAQDFATDVSSEPFTSSTELEVVRDLVASIRSRTIASSDDMISSLGLGAMASPAE